MGASCCTLDVGSALCPIHLTQSPLRAAKRAQAVTPELSRIQAAAGLALPLLLPELAAQAGIDLMLSDWAQVLLALPLAIWAAWRFLPDRD